MAFEANKLTDFFSLVSGLADFARDIQGLPIPMVPTESGSKADDIRALRRYAEESADAFRQLTQIDIPFATTDISSVADVFAEIETELTRTRAGHVRVNGNVDKVEVSDSGINIILSDSEEGDDGEIVTPANSIFVYAEKDGGSAGDADNTCSFTYSLYELDQATAMTKKAEGGDAATAMEPQKRRLVKTKYTTVTGKKLAVAFYDEDGDLVLWDANEIPYPPEAC